MIMLVGCLDRLAGVFAQENEMSISMGFVAQII